MAYTTTATDLTQELQNWMEDDDAEFVGSIPNIIGLGELRLVRDLDLSIFYATTTSPTVQGVATVVKPAGYLASPLGTKYLYYTVSGDTTFLELRTVDFIRDLLTTTEAPPLFFAEPDEVNWIVAPLPDAVYSLTARFLQRPPALTITSQENNWLSDNTADLLFKACLAESEAFLKSDDRIPIWEDQYQKLIPSAKRELYELMAARYPEPRAFPLGS